MRNDILSHVVDTSGLLKRRFLDGIAGCVVQGGRSEGCFLPCLKEK